MLNIQSNTEDNKYVGAKLPPRICSYLTLYSLAKGTNKSKIIKELIDSWMLKQRAKELDTVLIREVTSRINSQWLTSKVLNTQISFSKFKEIAQEELLAKGLLTNDVDSIMKGIKEK